MYDITMGKTVFLAMLTTAIALSSEAHPGISPFSYCGGNPVVMVDPDGRDYTMDIDNEKKTITISATYYTSDQDALSAQESVDFWNNQSGNFIYRSVNKKDDLDVRDFVVNFDLKVESCGDGGNSMSVKRVALDKAKADGTVSRNSYEVVTGDGLKKFAENKNGGTSAGKYIIVRESRRHSGTGAHEVGHTLGLVHGNSGLMTAESEDKRYGAFLTKDDIKTMIEYPLRGIINNEKGVGAGKCVLSPNSYQIDLKKYKGNVIQQKK